VVLHDQEGRAAVRRIEGGGGGGEGGLLLLLLLPALQLLLFQPGAREGGREGGREGRRIPMVSDGEDA